MSCHQHRDLLERWWNDQLTEDERTGLAKQLNECEDCRRELEGSRELWGLMGYMPVPEPSTDMQAQFNAMLDNYKASGEGRQPGAAWWGWFGNLFAGRPGLAAAFSLLLLLGGVGLGSMLRRPAAATGATAEKVIVRDTIYAAVAPPKAAPGPEATISGTPAKDAAAGDVRTVADSRPTSESKQLDALAAQVRNMRELMMLSLLQNPAASERIKAVSYTSEIRHVDPHIARVLLATLDNDPNVNVRLTTLEALSHFAEDPIIREGLVQSILQQNSPLVQAALADVMLQLQEKRAISPFKILLQQKDLNETVRTKIEETIVRLT